MFLPSKPKPLPLFGMFMLVGSLKVLLHSIETLRSGFKRILRAIFLANDTARKIHIMIWLDPSGLRKSGFVATPEHNESDRETDDHGEHEDENPPIAVCVR